LTSGNKGFAAQQFPIPEINVQKLLNLIIDLRPGSCRIGLVPMVIHDFLESFLYFGHQGLVQRLCAIRFLCLGKGLRRAEKDK
jgi:hypothetical protein